MPELCRMEDVGCVDDVPLAACRKSGAACCRPLRPFIHQVGGHSGMLHLDDCTICKPLIGREHNFYVNMPDDLLEFTPEYQGVISVQWLDDGFGSVSPVVCQSPACDNFVSESDDSCPSHASSDDLEADHIITGEACLPSHVSSKSRVCDDGISVDSVELPDNVDYSVAAQDFNSVSQSWHRLMSRQRPTEFILLENLTCHFHRPCVLDLKMGTRQHGDDASETKRLGHMKKCAESTSASLGFRVCGMQVYQVVSGEYLYQSKYRGRQLSVDGVRHTLRCFLHDGRRLRAELITPVIDRLRRLEKVIRRQDSFRFYSSSLLIMYDGSDTGEKAMEKDSPPALAVNMIDFAHATHLGLNVNEIVHVGPDTGYLFGLQNLICMFEELRADTSE